MENNIQYSACAFLDVDGVLNSNQFYVERYAHLTRYNGIPFYKTVKKYLRKQLKSKEIEKMDYYKGEMCPVKMGWLNEFCAETNTAVVLSASMRNQWNVEELQKIFNYCGATFTIIDKTCHTGYERGTEVSKWLKDNCMQWFGVNYYDFYKYVIFDDDSDFLIEQQEHLFQTDNYMGLTPTTLYKAKRFLTHQTF